MKKLILTDVVSVFCQLAICQVKIDLIDAGKHIGETVTVCSKVHGVKGTEKVSLINLGTAYPNAPVTIVIFAKHRKNFKEAPEDLYANKYICVTGKVEDYKGKSQIVISKEDEITTFN